MPDRSPQRWLLLAILLTVVIRVLVIAWMPNAFVADPDAYRAIATTISESGVFGLTGGDGNTRPTAFRPPLYPLLISFVSGGDSLRWSIGGVHVLLAAITAACVFTSTLRILRRFGSETGKFSQEALAASVSLLVAIDPVLLRQSTEIMTETLATTLTSVATLLWIRWIDSKSESCPKRLVQIDGILLGAVLALSYLCRPTFLVWAALILGVMFLVSRDRRTVMTTVLAAALVIVAVGGWTLRNLSVMDHPIWATSHGGYTLLLANNEHFYAYLNEAQYGEAWNAEPFLSAYEHRFESDPRRASFWNRRWTSTAKIDPSIHRNTITESEDDRLCYEAAMATIRRHPSTFLWSTVVRAGRFWSPAPHGVGSRSAKAIAAVTAFYVLLFSAAGVALVRHRGFFFTRPWWCVWMLAFTLTSIHAVYWSNMRMRAPLAPAIAMVTVFVMVPRKEDF